MYTITCANCRQIDMCCNRKTTDASAVKIKGTQYGYNCSACLANPETDCGALRKALLDYDAKKQRKSIRENPKATEERYRRAQRARDAKRSA